MEKIIFNKQCIENESFSDKNISKFQSLDSEFINCKFENMNIKDICFGIGVEKSKYINCSFNNSSFSSNVPGRARFENCSFTSVKIGKFFCIDIEMINCIMSGEIMQGNFVGVHRDVDGSSSKNEYRDNDFSKLKLGDVGFRDIDLTVQKMPVSSDFLVILDVNKFLSEAKTKANNIKDNAVSASVSDILNMIKLDSEGGNNQMFLDRRSYPKNLQNAVKVLFDF